MPILLIVLFIVVIFPGSYLNSVLDHLVYVLVEEGDVVLEEECEEDENKSLDQVADKHRLLPNFELHYVRSELPNVLWVVEPTHGLLVLRVRQRTLLEDLVSCRGFQERTSYVNV